MSRCFPTLGRTALVCAGLAAIVVGLHSSAQAQNIFRVEEDWEMVVTQPATEIQSPQVTLFTSPVADGLSKYFQLQLNHAADEWFSAGGFQVAAAISENVVDRARSQVTTTLNHNNDRIRWTVVMACFDGEFLYAVKDGYCQSWGNFGGPEYLVRMPAGDHDDLSNYSYQTSLDAVDLGFGKNRVSSLKLLRVRYYDVNGDVSEVSVSEPLDVDTDATADGDPNILE